jgi:hypothetical protein
MTAARSGDLRSVTALLAHGAAVATKERLGQNALMWAAAEGHPSAARVLLEHGASVHERSHTGFTPLLFAARAGDLETVRVLLAAGADIDESVPRVGTALVLASASMVGTTTGMRMVVTPSGHESLAMFLLGRRRQPERCRRCRSHRAALCGAERPARSAEGAAGAWRKSQRASDQSLSTAITLSAARLDETARVFVLGAHAAMFQLAAKAGDVATMRVLLARRRGSNRFLPPNKNTDAPGWPGGQHATSAKGRRSSGRQPGARHRPKLALELGGAP